MLRSLLLCSGQVLEKSRDGSAMGVLGGHFPNNLTCRAASLLTHCFKGHLESEIEQMTKW